MEGLYYVWSRRIEVYNDKEYPDDVDHEIMLRDLTRKAWDNYDHFYYASKISKILGYLRKVILALLAHYRMYHNN